MQFLLLCYLKMDWGRIFSLSFSLFALIEYDCNTVYRAFPACKTEDGLYRNHIQCDAYYECLDGQLYPRECKRGYQYLSSAKSCVESPKGQCHRTGLIFGCSLLWRGLGSKCYAISEMLSSFQHHIEACLTLENSYLAEIRTAEELKYVGMWLDQVYGDFLSDFYVNVKFDPVKKQWSYGDGSKVPSELFSPTDFQSYYSTCAAISRKENYTLRSIECKEAINALCQQDPNF